MTRQTKVSSMKNKSQLKSLFILTLVLLALMAIYKPAEARADDSVALAFTSQAGGIALYAAIENGFFEEEGLVVEPIKADLETFTNLLATGAVVGGELDYRLYHLVDKNVGATAGLYSGFLELLGTDPKSTPGAIKLVSENKGSGAAVAAARHLKGLGVDTVKDIVWLEAPLDELLEVLEKGDATLAARFEEKRKKGGHGEHGGGHGGASGHEHAPAHGHEHAPAHGGEQAHSGPNVVFSASASLPQEDPDTPSANPHAKHTSAHHFFASFVVLSWDFFDKDPAKAAAITRAWIRGASWVGEHKEEAQKLANEKGLWSGESEEINRYMWMPGVKHAKEHLEVYIYVWKERGILPADSDEKAIFEKLYIPALPDIN